MPAPSSPPSRPTTNFHLNDDERDAVDALIEYRLRLADKPFIKPLAITKELKAMSDSVLENERKLLMTLADNIEEEVIEMLSEKETYFLALARHKEMSTLLEGGLSRASRLRNQLAEMKREKDRRKAIAINMSASERAARLEQETANSITNSRHHHRTSTSRQSTTSPSRINNHSRSPSNGNNNNDSPSSTKNLFSPTTSIAGMNSSRLDGGDHRQQNNSDPSSLTAKTLEDIERQVEIESSLAQHSEKTLTVLYPTYLDFIGRIAMMRRRCDLEKDWSVSTANELEVVENKMKTLKSQDSYRKQQLKDAREKLDEANRAMFMSRRELTVTHHRILGLEKLKNGSVIDAQTSIDLVNRIRKELQQNNGESETFQRLMDTECAELCDISAGSNSTSTNLLRRQQQMQQQFQQQQQNEGHQQQGGQQQQAYGAQPFVLSQGNASRISRR